MASLPVLRRKDEKRALGWHGFVVVDAVGQGRSGFVAGPACVRCHTNSSVVVFTKNEHYYGMGRTFFTAKLVRVPCLLAAFVLRRLKLALKAGQIGTGLELGKVCNQ